MALFPAFAEIEINRPEDSPKELDWLNNKSFQSADAVLLHSRFLSKSSETSLAKRPASAGRDVSSPDEKSDDDGDSQVSHRKKRKKHEKKKKKKKKYKKKSGRYSDGTASDSDIVFPSDLNKEEEAERKKVTPLASCFCWLDDFQSSTEQPFCVDRKPDPANWTYKSLYRGDVTRYKRKGNSCLGLDSRTEGVGWEESDKNKKQKGGNSKHTADRYFSKTSQQLLRCEPPVQVTAENLNDSDDVNTTSFLPLSDIDVDNKGPTGDRKPLSSVNPLGVYDSSTALWLQGKGQQKPEIQTGIEGTPLLSGRTEEFNRRLREDPTDTRLWLEFIRYQDELNATVFGGEEEQPGSESIEHRKSSYKAVLEKKLSIADRAITTNPTCIALQLERLKICQEMWEPAILAKEWKKLVFLHPNSAPLWKEYLLFTQSYFSNFTVSRVNSAYGKCLSTLSAVRDGSMVSHAALPGTEEEMLDIFAQQCHFLRQAGHAEKAISLFQAMMDFTFYKPDSVQKLSTKQQVDFFEPFWDSGEARVGELGARGWKAWMHQQERGGWLQPSEEEDEEEEEEDEDEVKDRSQPRWTVWLDVESSREAAQWLPWRPDKAKGQSEEDCEDPDRQVLFDDIGPSLICLSSPELQLRFLLHFLSFLGLPVDPVLSAASCQPSLTLENLSFLTAGTELRHPLTCFDLPDTGVNSVGHTVTLQGTRKWVGLGKQAEKFVKNILSMVQPVLPPLHQSCLTLSWIQYEKLKVLRCLRSGNKKRLRIQGKSSKRVAKCLLKEPDNRSSLTLWREYAHLEWMLGNVDEARKVFSTATTMGGSKGLSNPVVCELCLLWAKLEIENAAAEQGGRLADVTTSPAVCVLSRLTEGTNSSSSSPSQALSPVFILKARKSYEQALTASLTALEQNLQCPESSKKGLKNLLGEKLGIRGLAGCYALFQYLTVSIHAANAVYSQTRDRLEELYRTLIPDKQAKSKKEANHASGESSHTAAPGLSVSWLASECEALAVQQAALLMHHNNISVFPLATLRHMLTSALSAWSCSTPLWCIYIQVENRYHSAGRARRFFLSVTREASSVVPHLFAIVAEQQRKQLVDAAQRSCGRDDPVSILPENGLSNRIRGLFENATATDTGAHCPLLWRMYIHFLVSEGKSHQAKGIFYKALQNIPWTKGLYMDAVQLFPEQLQEFVDLMTEKEIRLRLPLEELDILLED